MINRQGLREAMDLEICSHVDRSIIDKYICYQKALDDFCSGNIPPQILIDQLGADSLINIDEYLNNLSENLKWL